jgi:hypothetical protein
VRFYCRSLLGLFLMGCLLLFSPPSPGQSDGAKYFFHLDLTQPENQGKAIPMHDIEKLEYTSEGLIIHIGGVDPYVGGPPRDYPENTPLWFRVRLRSDSEGMAQLFWFTDSMPTSEERAVRFGVSTGWGEYEVPVPSFGKGYQIRFDPPGDSGVCVVSWLEFETRMIPITPEWPQPPAQEVVDQDQAKQVQSGNLAVTYGSAGFGNFEVSVDGKPFAQGLSNSLIGTLKNDQIQWTPYHADKNDFRIEKDPEKLTAKAGIKDVDGGKWNFTQVFTPAKVEGAIDVETTITVDQDRDVVYLPVLMVFPGAGEPSFGTRKDQALFSGLEYLADEPSSSTADLKGLEAKRQVPDSVKITLPLMSIVEKGQYLGLIWEKSPDIAAVFDSPDRLFASGGHVMGLIAPGSEGTNREEGNLLPYKGMMLKAGQPFVLQATLIGGPGESVAPSLKKYVELRGLPEPPAPGTDLKGYLHLAARGWLDSAIRRGNTYVHSAAVQNMAYLAPYHPNAEAALWMHWLAGQEGSSDLSEPLEKAAKETLEPLRPDNLIYSRLSHVPPPCIPLVFGDVAGNLNRVREHVANNLSRFNENGVVVYHPEPGKNDYGKTHYENHANGLTSQALLQVLEGGSLLGDQTLIDKGLALLDQQKQYRHTVPRGAQTWEVPLHTPDILASANMIKAYSLGYQLTGREEYLEEARYWAWTGLPFVYLVPPVDKPVGLYSTVAVYGATWWIAPVWMGLPVQWCGLVYAHALYGLNQISPDPVWKRVADGITASGIKQVWPEEDSDYRGLLPDSWHLRTQVRNLTAINPGTLLGTSAGNYWASPLYTFHSFLENGVLLHVPGSLSDLKASNTHLSFKIEGWPKTPYWLLLARIPTEPKVDIDGKPLAGSEVISYDSSTKRLILKIEGSPNVKVTW